MRQFFAMSFLLAVCSAPVFANNWAEKVNLGGDLRFRFENKGTKDSNDTVDQYRIRARVKLHSQLSEKTKVTMQFASGGGDITSTNQTLTGNFTNKNFELDMAYFDHTLSDGLTVIAGKMKNPYIRPGKSDLIWDGDLTPEGIALVYNKDMFMANLSEMQISRAANVHFELLAAQLGVNLEVGAGSLIFGVGNFAYTDTEGQAVFNSAKGNSEISSGVYANNYNISQVFLEYGIAISELPVVFFADVISNPEAEEYNKGYLAGVSLGKAKKAGSWSAKILYRKLEKDATIGAFTDGDFGDGGTDVQGAKLSLKHALSDQGSLELTHYANEKIISDETNKKDYSKTHVDFVFKF